MALESFKRRAVLVKAEATENTDALPIATADGLLMLDGSSKIEADVIERAIDRAFFGGDPFVLSKIRGSIEGDIELIGAAVAGSAAPIATALRMSGMAETLIAATVGPPATPAITRYNPISTGIISATSYFYHAGTLKKLTGCRANISSLALKIGDFPKARLSILGNASGVVDEAALPVVSLSAFQTPVPGSTETMLMTVNGFAVEGIDLSLDFGSDLKIAENTESRLARINGRSPTFSATFYRPLKASLDPYALWKAHTQIPLIALVDGGSAGKRTRLTIGQGQIEGIEEVEQDGDFAYRISGRAIPTSAGNNEFLVEFE